MEKNKWGFWRWLVTAIIIEDALITVENCVTAVCNQQVRERTKRTSDSVITRMQAVEEDLRKRLREDEDKDVDKDQDENEPDNAVEDDPKEEA